MDRMSFVPGAEAREQIQNAGHIVVDRETAVEYVDKFAEYLMRIPTKDTNGTMRYGVMYTTILSSLSIGDRIDIKYGGRSPTTPEDGDPSGELIGFTWATFVGADGREKVLWDFGRDTEPLSDEYAMIAFNLYRKSLAEFKGIPEPEPLPTTIPSTTSI